MARPKNPAVERRTAGVYLETPVIARVDELAARRGMTRSRALAWLIARGLDLDRAAELSLVEDSVTFATGAITYRVEASYKP